MTHSCNDFELSCLFVIAWSAKKQQSSKLWSLCPFYDSVSKPARISIAESLRLFQCVKLNRSIFWNVCFFVVKHEFVYLRRCVCFGKFSLRVKWDLDSGHFWVQCLCLEITILNSWRIYYWRVFNAGKK